MSSTEQARIPMPPVLVVALTVVSVILLTIAVAFAPVAVFALAWRAPVGLIGIVAWVVVAVMTVLVMAGKSWARFGIILLPLSLGALVLASEGVGLFSIVLLGAGMALVAVCLMFNASASAYFRAVAARGRAADAMGASTAS